MSKAFLLLLVFNVFLICVHYYEADDLTAGGAEQFAYNQEIEVINKKEEFVIRHHFNNLPNTRLEIVWPKHSEQRSCHLENAKACNRINGHVTAFTDGEEKSQSISYVIPKDGSMEDAKLFTSNFAVLHKMEAKATVLHFTDETNIGGMWLTGLREKGSKKMDFIDYTLFSGTGPVYDLYWQQQELPVIYSSNELTIYGEAPLNNKSDIQQFENAIQLFSAPHSAIIFRNGKKQISAQRIFVTDDRQRNQAYYEFMLNQVQSAYKTTSDDAFAVEMATSILLDEEAGTDFTKEAYRLLQRYLTETERQQLIERIIQIRGKDLNADVLNYLFEEVTGYGTSFFTKNSQSAEQPYPFLLEIPQDIAVAGTGKLDTHAILKDSRIYYPIGDIVESLGYEMSSNDQSLYIESAARKYRFPMNHLFYVYNEKRVDIPVIPFERIEGDFYFEESAMIKIFQLELEKTSKAIEIAPIAIESEGKS